MPLPGLVLSKISNILGVTIYLSSISTLDGASSTFDFSTNTLTLHTLSSISIPSTIQYLNTFS
ncbi:hypothetical protein GCM10008916_02860 [Clostridium nitritogenes]|uniref:Uncharacterized protein n=1 Tax=Clostridium nitritogenes TaxID=83340 RepID=A0ABN1LGM9_9CLOT